MQLAHVKTKEEPKMKYIVEVNNMDGEYRHFEFEEEAKALHEFRWYSMYTEAESVTITVFRD